MSEDKLGPLPNRYDVVTRCDDDGRMIAVPVWTEADMRAYAEQAAAAERERCVRIAEHWLEDEWGGKEIINAIRGAGT